MNQIIGPGTERKKLKIYNSPEEYFKSQEGQTDQEIGELDLNETNLKNLNYLEAKERYEQLKQTLMYDPDSKIKWYSKLERQKRLLKDQAKYITDQLLDIWALIELGERKEAREYYEQLKDTELFNYKLNQFRWWCSSENKEFENQDEKRTDNKLLELIVRNKMKIENTEEEYEELLKTKAYIPSKNLWNTSISADEKNVITSLIPTHDKLLEIILLNQLGRKNIATVEYNRFIETQYYSKKRKVWNANYDQDHTNLNEDEYSKTLLIGVIANSKVDIENARLEYQNLTRSKLYNPNTKYWYLKHEIILKMLSEQIYTESQLFNIITLLEIGKQNE